MLDCLTCTAYNLCTSCTNGKFLKFDNSGCVSNCLVTDIGIFLYCFNKNINLSQNNFLNKIFKGSCVDNVNYKCLKNIVTNNNCVLCNNGLLC